MDGASGLREVLTPPILAQRHDVLAMMLLRLVQSGVSFRPSIRSVTKQYARDIISRALRTPGGGIFHMASASEDGAMPGDLKRSFRQELSFASKRFKPFLPYIHDIARPNIR